MPIIRVSNAGASASALLGNALLFLLATGSAAVTQRTATMGTAAARSAAIPEWKVEVALNPEDALKIMRGGDGAPQSHQGATSKSVDDKVVRIGSTPAQDSQHCPLVKLPDALSLIVQEGTYTGTKGNWATNNNVVLASWGQNFYNLDWQQTTYRNLDKHDAFQTEVLTAEELEYLYGWKVETPLSDYPKIERLERRWQAAMAQGLSMEGYTSEKRVQQYVSIADCAGHLLFVVRLMDGHGRPGSIDIYDRRGVLAAHAIAHHDVAMYQFVDGNGYLLATAEAPGVGQNISMTDLPKDPAKGNIFSYGIKFEKGGYENSSSLVEEEYRWVIGIAVQARALADAQEDWSPGLPKVMVAVYWVLFGVGIIALIGVCMCLYRIVYPPLPSTRTKQVPGSAITFLPAKSP